MRDELRSFITAELIRDLSYPLQDDENLITGGLVDSFSLVELQLFIERTFGVFIVDTDMTAANMDTLNLIVSHIEAYQR